MDINNYVSAGSTVTTASFVSSTSNEVAGVNINSNYINTSTLSYVFNGSNRYAGGLVGGVCSISTATNVVTSASINYTAVTSSSWNGTDAYVKGLVGRKSTTDNSITLSSDDNYFDATTASTMSEVSPYNDNSLTTTAMKNTTFSGWDSTTIWLFSAGSYPVLR